MHKLLAGVAALALLASPAFAQSTSGSNSDATAGSVSGASNNNSTTNGPQTTTVRVDPVNNGNGQADSRSNSTSSSGAISGSTATGGASDSRSTATGGTSSATTGASTATNGTATSGNAQNITFNSTVPAHTTAEIKSVPTVYAPAMTTTLTETCMGSSSAGGAGMGFGFSLGSTWHDKQCVRRLNARELAQTLGDRDAARALMCQDDDVAKAYADIGQPCKIAWVAPQPEPKGAEAPPVVPYSAPPPVSPPPLNKGERGSLPAKDHHG